MVSSAEVNDECPPGRTAQTALHVLLEACTALSAKINLSRTPVAMDGYVTSAPLLLARASHNIFAEGTLRGKREPRGIGLGGAALEESWHGCGGGWTHAFCPQR